MYGQSNGISSPLQSQAEHARMLRSHRSMSSVASAESLESSQSWLESSTTASEQSSETEPEAPLARRSTTLSIDPKLFQTRPKVDDDKLATARPPKLKSPVEKSGKKKVSHARKQHPEHIPRPRNAFILFRKHVVDSKLIPPSVEMRHQNVSVIVAKMWSEAGSEQKARFNELARVEKEEHMKKYPGYRYQPVYRRTNVIRRRVRKDDAEEEKCKSVAELLLKGKSGHVLEREIRKKINQDFASAETRAKTGANELSKGALRAIRAQSRRQSTPSLDWSDCGSRAASVEPEPCPSIGAYDMPADMPYAEPAFVNAACDWTMNPPVQQTYAYPNDHTQFVYQQPPLAFPLSNDFAIPDFYAYDRALPFSPTGGSFGDMADQGLPSISPGAMDQDQVFGAYPSPTSGFYAGDGNLRLQCPPASARWDRAHLLPPSSELGLDGLGFDGEDFLLQDFGAALAQATHTEEPVW